MKRINEKNCEHQLLLSDAAVRVAVHLKHQSLRHLQTLATFQTLEKSALGSQL